MSPQRRKSLADADAAAFIFGTPSSTTTTVEDQPTDNMAPEPQTAPNPQPEAKPTPAKATTAKRAPAKKKTKSNRAIDELMQSTKQERQVRITVDLAASQHQALTLVCAKLGKPKAEIIRALVDDFLDEVNQ